MAATMQEIMLVNTKVRGMMYLQKIHNMKYKCVFRIVVLKIHLETKIPLSRPVMKQV